MKRIKNKLKRYRVKKNGNRGWITWAESRAAAIQKIRRLEGPGRYTAGEYSTEQSIKDVGMPNWI